MNGDISRIPIQTLGAVISLTDTLQDLPLPSATNNSLRQETLLQHPGTYLDAAYFLPFHEPGVKDTVLDALSQTDSNNIEFFENYVPRMNDLNSLPNELRNLIEENRTLFSSKAGFADLLGFPFDAGESKNISDSCDSHGKRKKKKKKKKKRKHREAGGDTSETDSNPASITGNNGNGESHIRYIKMDQSEKKISLKISLKKPLNEEDGERKERKKKKHKNRSKYADEELEQKTSVPLPPSQEHVSNATDLPSSSLLNNNNNGQSFDQYLDPTDLQIMDDYFKKELAQYPNTQSNNTSYMLSDILNQPTHDLDLSAISDVPAAPTGLAGYLGSAPTPRPSKGKPDFIGSHGPPPPSRRTKRRRNELEELQNWTVKYPEGQSTEMAGGKSTWERALGSYSQALGEKAKRRKRMSRHPQTSGGMNSSYVFEGDEEYPNDHNDSDYEPDSEPGEEMTNGRPEMLNGKITSGRSSSRLKSYVGMAADEEEGDEDVKRRGRADEDTPFEVRLKDSVEQRFPHLMQKSADRSKRRERVGFRASMGLSHQKHQHLDDESAAENSIETSLARFSARLDTLFESIEELDLLKCLGGGASFKLPPEAAISLTDLAELCRHAAKLKATKVTNRLNTDKLVKLLTLLLLNLRDGEGVVPTLEGGEQEDEQSCRLWRELAMERVMRSVQSSLVGLHLMTSVDMPREVYLEDFIQSSVQVVRFQLFNCIYPEYDPAYRTDNSGKENQSSIKSRRARQKEVQKSRNVVQLYHRLVECVAGLGELVEMQRLTDGIVLSLSSMGVSIFFVENICELQLAALKLVTGLFSLYVPHRKLIIEDILASLARLPSSKRNLRSYRLNTEDSIQMLTALALLLVQSVIVLHEDEMSIISSYQDAMRTAHMFLTAFLKKSTIKGEDDYRMIFENFVNDLLLTVNKPEWPAAEVMLSLLGSLLVQQFNNKSLDQPTRVASVDYLGTVASTLRRDAVNSQLRERDIDNILRQLLQGDGDEEEGEGSRELRSKCHAVLGRLDRVQALRDALVDYLFAEQEDPTAIYARRFYLGQWLSDCTKEGEKKSEQEALALAEKRRAYLLDKASERYDQWRSKRRNRWNSPPELFGVVFRGQLDYEEACMVCRYLASMRPFSQSFDIYLSQICKLLSETSVPVRTKALRCLSAVVEADPDVLARKDIQSAVHSRLLDSSTSVREAAVDLLGRFLLCRPELTNRYYPMLAERILDKGVSVRKRVIRILRDICLEQPDFPRIPEICIKMIRRVNDEEGIKKLVNEVFQMMWFTPVRERDSVRLIRKVMNITEVVAACRKTGYDWFEQFLCNLLKKEECEKVRPVERACKQIVESLVETVMRLEEVTIPSSVEGGRLLACIATLHLFTKIRPELMVQNTLMLQPYLAIKCQNANDAHIAHHVARILEVTVPLLEHPSPTMIARLETDIVTLTLKYGKMVLESCVACLGAVVNKVSRNYPLVKDCFYRFFNTLIKVKTDLQAEPNKALSTQLRSSLLRALFTVGLLCKHFDCSVFQQTPSQNVRDLVFETLMFFVESGNDLDVRKNALSGLGFLSTRYHELLCGSRLCKFYQQLLQFPCPPPSLNDASDDNSMLSLKSMVLENLFTFFQEEERRMLEADSRWKKVGGEESLKEMCDVASGMCSSVAQTYLPHVLECFYCVSSTVRLTALSLIATILRQGLIHPIQTVANLISMQTDTDPNVRVKADAQLCEIDCKFPGFVNMRAAQGLSLSYRLQFMLYEQVTSDEFKMQQSSSNAQPQASYGSIRGSWNPEADVPSALNSQLYSMLRGNRTQRRSFLNSLISLFDESNRLALSKLVYIADNVAHFPYQVQEEPLFIIHHIDLLVSISGSNVLQAVREALFPELKAALERAMQEQAQMEAKQRVESEMRLKQQLQYHQTGMNQALHANDQAGAETHHEAMQNVANKLQQLSSMHSAVSGISGLRSAALMGREALDALGPLEEEEEDELALIERLQKCQATALPAMREATRTSRACVLLLMLKQFLKDVYGVSDAKLQKYSPSDSAKLWERPLTRRVGVRFHPVMCLSVAGQELKERLQRVQTQWLQLRKSDKWAQLLRSFQTGLQESSTSGLGMSGVTSNTTGILPSQLSAALQQHESLSRQGGQSYSKLVAEHYKFNDDIPRWQDEKDSSPFENYDGEITTLAREYLEFRKLILTIDPQNDEDDAVPAPTEIASSSAVPNNNTKSLIVDSALPSYLGDPNFSSQQQQPPPQKRPPRQTVSRTLVPQSHNRETDEEESEDSDAGGASRLMLAQSAPRPKATRNAPKRKSAALSRTKNLIVLDDSDEDEEDESDSSVQISDDDEY